MEETDGTHDIASASHVYACHVAPQCFCQCAAGINGPGRRSQRVWQRGLGEPQGLGCAVEMLLVPTSTCGMGHGVVIEGNGEGKCIEMDGKLEGGMW